MTRMLPILVLFALFATFVVAFYLFFQAKNINIETEKDCISKDTAQGYVKTLKTNLLTLRENALYSSFKSKFTCIDRIQIEKKYPNTLNLLIFSNLPIAKIENTNLTINYKGLIEESSQTANIPSIFISDTSSLQKGQAVSDESVIFAVNLAKALKSSDFTLYSIRILDPENIIAYNPEGTLVIFSSNKELDSQIRSLHTVLAKSKINATKISKIDVRSVMPVIVFK